ncbi:MAG: hypothetical protein II919_08475 [Lachnospiraceae bacterium]|nr:hypothetical protein [Lachnospiraceae bacterium]
MKNIAKSQLYQLRKSKLSYGIFFVILFLQLFTIVATVLNNFDGPDVTGSSFVAEQGAALFLTPIVFLSIITGIVTGADFMDKTTNYEIMTGHTRYEVFWGRVIPALIISITGGFILAILPMTVAKLLFGWGTKMRLKGVVLRFILIIFPYFRIVCEFIFLSFVVRNEYIIMTLGFVYYMLGSILAEGGNGSSSLLGLTNLNSLGNYGSFSTYNVLDGATVITVYDSSVGASAIVSTIVNSLLIGSFFLLIGYIFFKNDDLS